MTMNSSPLMPARPGWLLRIEHPDQVEDPGKDHQDAEQDRDHVSDPVGES